ncbi:MAG: holo-ACP synthase [Candidatus Rhabdochlamydia sp.]
MKFLGIGNDIIEIQRVRDVLKRQGKSFMKRVLTPQEEMYCLEHQDPDPHVAARFSVKESVVKALGCGIGKEVRWHDIEIVRDSKGKPQAVLSEHVSKKFNHPVIHISISHCKNYVATVALIYENTPLTS